MGEVAQSNQPSSQTSGADCLTRTADELRAAATAALRLQHVIGDLLDEVVDESANAGLQDLDRLTQTLDCLSTVLDNLSDVAPNDWRVDDARLGDGVWLRDLVRRLRADGAGRPAADGATGDCELF